jgi:hypothetical protein
MAPTGAPSIRRGQSKDDIAEKNKRDRDGEMPGEGNGRRNQGAAGCAAPLELSYGLGLRVASKMSVRFVRFPSFAMPKRATNEFPARARPS